MPRYALHVTLFSDEMEVVKKQEQGTKDEAYFENPLSLPPSTTTAVNKRKFYQPKAQQQWRKFLSCSSHHLVVRSHTLFFVAFLVLFCIHNNIARESEAPLLARLLVPEKE